MSEGHYLDNPVHRSIAKVCRENGERNYASERRYTSGVEDVASSRRIVGVIHPPHTPLRSACGVIQVMSFGHQSVTTNLPLLV